MLFCKKCQIDYDDGKRFCPQCGSFLIKKENFLSDFEETETSTEEKPKEKFICPDCKIIYEKAKACIRCGKETVLSSSLQTQKEVENVQEPDLEKDSSTILTMRDWVETKPEHLICPACKKEHLGGKACIRCGAELMPHVTPPVTEKPLPLRSLAPKKSEHITPLPPERKEDLFQQEVSDEPPPKRTVQEQLKKGRWLRKVKKDYPRMILNWSGLAIILIAGGYLLWSMYAHVIPKKSDSFLPPLLQEKATMPTPATSVSPSSSPSSTEDDEMDKIKSLLENIRKANLSKDIDLFLSCYSNDFKDREKKKRATLQSWENFNFLDLIYELRNLSLSGHRARAKVEWLVRFSSKGSGAPQESRTLLDVVFKKEDGVWKIGEILSES